MARRGQRAPKIPLAAAPSKGNSGIIHRFLSISIPALQLQQIDAFDVERLPVPRDHDDDGQAHRCLRGSHHDYKKYEHLPLQLPEGAPKRDESKIDEIGRASCRERVLIALDDASLKW